MTLPSAVLFDWDNTLIDTFPVMLAAHNAVRDALGFPAWSESDGRSNIRLAAKDAFPIWYGDRAKKAEDVYTSFIRAHHLQHMDVFDGADDLIRYLAGIKMPMGIVSNKRREFLRAEIKAAGWDGLFPAIIGADDLKGPGKPDPGGIFLALETLGLTMRDRSQNWYVGDTENDVKTARTAGLIPVYIENYTMNTRDEIMMLGPLISFKNPRECLAYIKALG